MSNLKPASAITPSAKLTRPQFVRLISRECGLIEPHTRELNAQRKLPRRLWVYPHGFVEWRAEGLCKVAFLANFYDRYGVFDGPTFAELRAEAEAIAAFRADLVDHTNITLPAHGDDQP